MGVWPRQPNFKPVARTGLRYPPEVLKAAQTMLVATKLSIICISCIVCHKMSACHPTYCHGVLRLLHADQPGADPADPGGHTFDDGSVQDRDGQVSRADVVDGGVGSSNVSLGNLNAPEDLNKTEHGHPTDDLSDGSNDGLLLRHVALNA